VATLIIDEVNAFKDSFHENKLDMAEVMYLIYNLNNVGIQIVMVSSDPLMTTT